MVAGECNPIEDYPAYSPHPGPETPGRNELGAASGAVLAPDLRSRLVGALVESREFRFTGGSEQEGDQPIDRMEQEVRGRSVTIVERRAPYRLGCSRRLVSRKPRDPPQRMSRWAIRSANAVSAMKSTASSGGEYGGMNAAARTSR